MIGGAFAKWWLEEAALLWMGELDVAHQKFEGGLPSRLQLVAYGGPVWMPVPGLSVGAAYEAFAEDLSVRGTTRQAVDLEAPVMPPDHALTARQREILERWFAQGGPKGTRENRAPQAQLTSPLALPPVVDQSLEVQVRSWDQDGDGLWTQVAAREVGATEETVLGPRLGGGLRTTVLDTGVLASGRTFQLLALVDDGFSDDPAANRTPVVLGELTVDHGAAGTAPSVTLLRPNLPQPLFGTTEIAWTATDPDPGDALTIDLDLYRVLASGALQFEGSITADLPPGTQTYSWTPTGIPAENADGTAISYSVRVTATDGVGNVRFDHSDAPFTLAPPPRTTTLTWADVKPIFLTYCEKCHGEPARSPKLEYFRLDKYDAADTEAPANADQGVYELRGEVYQKVFVAGTMPPAAEPQPTAAQLEQLKNWLLGGAPRGGGPVDGPPTFSWNTPSDSAITKTLTGTVTLNWSATDPEGLPFTAGAIFVAEISAPADQAATCGTSTTGWTEVPGIDLSTGTTPWTAPRLGYFCFQGQVTDAAGQTTVKIAARPVKYSSR